MDTPTQPPLDETEREVRMAVYAMSSAATAALERQALAKSNLAFGDHAAAVAALNQAKIYLVAIQNLAGRLMAPSGRSIEGVISTAKDALSATGAPLDRDWLAESKMRFSGPMSAHEPMGIGLLGELIQSAQSTLEVRLSASKEPPQEAG